MIGSVDAGGEGARTEDAHKMDPSIPLGAIFHDFSPEAAFHTVGKRKVEIFGHQADEADSGGSEFNRLKNVFEHVLDPKVGMLRELQQLISFLGLDVEAILAGRVDL